MTTDHQHLLRDVLKVIRDPRPGTSIQNGVNVGELIQRIEDALPTMASPSLTQTGIPVRESERARLVQQMGRQDDFAPFALSAMTTAQAFDRGMDVGESGERARIVAIIEQIRSEYRVDDDLESMAASGALTYALAKITEGELQDSADQ